MQQLPLHGQKLLHSVAGLLCIRQLLGQEVDVFPGNLITRHLPASL